MNNDQQVASYVVSFILKLLFSSYKYNAISEIDNFK